MEVMSITGAILLIAAVVVALFVYGYFKSGTVTQ